MSRLKKRFKQFAFILVCAITFILFITFYLVKDHRKAYDDFAEDLSSSRRFSRQSAFPTNKANNQNKLPVWPEDLPGTDRIREQLQLNSSSGKTKRIYVAPNEFKVPFGSSHFIGSRCLVNQCEFVKNADDADAVIFKDRIYRSRKGVPSSQIWILYVLESPEVSGYTFPDEPDSVNWTATYRPDSEIVAPYEKWIASSNPSIKKNTINMAAGKTKKVAWFVSNCLAHNRRKEYAQELSKYISVDIYGRCGNKTCPRSDSECFNMLKSEYKFYLSFENANCRHYVTEKFFVNALCHDIVPIVMGALPDDYLAVAPKGSFVHVENFPSPRDLAEYLKLIDSDDDLYNSFFDWKNTGEFIDTKFFCRVCALLHQPRDNHFYPNFRQWWADAVCREDGWYR